MKFRAIIAWVCNMFDTVITIYLWTTLGPEGELNQISVWLLSQSTGLFAIVKISLASIGLLGCWLYRHLKICDVLVWVIFIEYVLLTIYYMHELIWAWNFIMR